jgi:hypothetical protein
MDTLDFPTQPFSTTSVISLISGVLVNNPAEPDRNAFNDLHELIEFVAGGPVWTHMLGDEEFVDTLTIRAIAAITPEDRNWILPVSVQVESASQDQCLAIAYEAFYVKPEINVMKLPEIPMETIIEAFFRPLQDKEVIVVET